MMAAVPSTAVEEFLDLAISGQRTRAVRFVLGLLDDGVAVSTLIHEVLTAAQQRVGERWQRGEWSTADEHLVTGVTQATLDALASTASDTDAQGSVVVACAEGDWHALSSQLFAESLRAAGQGVVSLGASTPAGDVASFLEQRRPDALAVSCSLPLAYLGVARVADAAHAHGVPVLAGGRALTQARAARLGADAWAVDVDEARAVLRAWQHDPPQVAGEPMQLNPAAVRLESAAEELAERAFTDLERAFPPMGDYTDWQRSRTREDLAYIVRFAAAARLVDDATVFTDFHSWLADLLDARGVVATALPAGLAALAGPVREIDPDAHRLIAGDAVPQP